MDAKEGPCVSVHVATQSRRGVANPWWPGPAGGNPDAPHP